MFAKWLEEYRRLSEKSRFLSKLSAFFLSMFTLLSLLAWLNYSEFIIHLTPDEKAEYWLSIFFQLAVFIVFASRFVLLFFNTRKIFWFSQILSFLGLIILASYWLESRPSDSYYKFFPDEWVIFRYAFPTLEWFGLYYLILSPARKILTLILAILKSK